MLDDWKSNEDSPVWIDFHVFPDGPEVPLPPPLAAGHEGGGGGHEAVRQSSQCRCSGLGGHVKQPALSRWGSPELYEM